MPYILKTYEGAPLHRLDPRSYTVARVCVCVCVCVCVVTKSPLTLSLSYWHYQMFTLSTGAWSTLDVIQLGCSVLACDW